jgi:hypothetical protein
MVLPNDFQPRPLFVGRCLRIAAYRKEIKGVFGAQIGIVILRECAGGRERCSPWACGEGARISTNISRAVIQLGL